VLRSSCFFFTHPASFLSLRRVESHTPFFSPNALESCSFQLPGFYSSCCEPSVLYAAQFQDRSTSSPEPAANKHLAPLYRISRSPGSLIRVNQTKAHKLQTPRSRNDETSVEAGIEIASLHTTNSLRDRRSRFAFHNDSCLCNCGFSRRNKVLFRRSHLNEPFQSTTSTFLQPYRHPRLTEQTTRQSLQDQITDSSLLHHLPSRWRNSYELRYSAQPLR
jgi:hypothetical protein